MRLKLAYQGILILCLVYNHVQGRQKFEIDQAHSRPARFMSLFNLIQFRNEECQGSQPDHDVQGICLSPEECSDNGGIKIGTCAAGFGTCCLVEETSCGGTISHNNTYFRNQEYPQSSTAAQVCTWTFTRKNANICFYRLDFLRLEVGNVNHANEGACDTDTVAFTQGSGFFISNICGNNNGLHMYLDAGPEDGALTSSMTLTTTGTSTSRYWRIKVAQIPCGTPYTPWQGCRMYYTKNADNFMSYNYQGEFHLQHQEYTICVRRNKGMCRIAYTAANSGISFKLSGRAGQSTALVGPYRCSGDYALVHWGAGGAGTTCVGPSQTDSTVPRDNVLIPFQFANRYCGSSLGCYMATPTSRGRVVQAMSPFEFGLHTNNNEGNNEVESFGFNVDYTQLPCP